MTKSDQPEAPQVKSARKILIAVMICSAPLDILLGMSGQQKEIVLEQPDRSDNCNYHHCDLVDPGAAAVMAVVAASG